MELDSNTMLVVALVLVFGLAILGIVLRSIRPSPSETTLTADEEAEYLKGNRMDPGD